MTVLGTNVPQKFDPRGMGLESCPEGLIVGIPLIITSFIRLKSDWLVLPGKKEKGAKFFAKLCKLVRVSRDSFVSIDYRATQVCCM